MTMTNTSTLTPGTLYLVPAPLDFGCDETPDLQATLPLGTLQAAAGLRHWVCENAKSARAYLKRIHEVTPLCCSIQEMQLVELPREVVKAEEIIDYTRRDNVAERLVKRFGAAVGSAAVQAAKSPAAVR